MRILILGAGAMGGYFGGRLVEAGQDVTFLVRDGRKAALDKNGLVINSPACGDFQAPVNAITAKDLAGQAPFDIVVLACKAYDLDASIEAIASAVGPKTAVLPFLNGLAHMEVLNKRFGAERVLGGVVRISATLGADGTINHHNDWRFITVGEQTGEMSDRVTSFVAAFGETAVVAAAVPHIMQEMWDKVVQLCTIATMTCLMRATVREIILAGGADMMVETLEESAAIAEKVGRRPSAAFLERARKVLTDVNNGVSASMLYDIERGGPIESDHILGYMLNVAKQYGVRAHILEVAHLHLKSYEQRRAADRL